jgi:sugar lactone lactonase YvrE
VADTGNNRIQKFTSYGTFITKWGEQGQNEGQFSSPSGITTDTSDNVYVADTGNDRIQKFTSGGKYLSSIGEFGHGKEKFNLPVDIDIDSKDNIFVADKGNNRIQKIEGSSVKKWLEEYKFDSPSGVALDGIDNLYVSDTNNHKIHRFDANGKNVTNCECSFGGLGFFSNKLYFPSGIDVDDDSGDVYVVDEGNNQIKRFIVKKTPTRETNLFPFNDSK